MENLEILYVPTTVSLQLYRGGNTVSLSLSNNIIFKKTSDTKENSFEYFPVEWIEILAPRNRIQKIGLLWTALFLSMAFTAVQLWLLWSEVRLMLLLVIALATSWVSIFSIGKAVIAYRKGVPTGRIRLSPSSHVLEFFYSREVNKDIDLFFDKLLFLKSEIADPIPFQKLKPLVSPQKTGRFKESFVHFNNKDFIKAENTLKQYLDKNPQDVYALRFLIEILINLGKFKQAHGICDILESKNLLKANESNDIRTYIWTKEHIFIRLDKKDREQTYYSSSDIPSPEIPDETEAAQKPFGIEIKKAGISEKTWLHLQGNILVYTEAKRTGVMKFYTPVENVKVLPPARRRGTGLLLWIPLFFVLALPMFFIIPDAIRWGSRLDILITVIIASVFLGIITIFFRYIYRGSPTGRLMLGPEGSIVEFLYKPGRDKLIDSFFRRLWYLQRSVNAPSTTRPTIKFTPKRLSAFQRWIIESVSLTALISTVITGIVYGFKNTGKFILKDFFPYLLLILPAIRFFRRKYYERMHLKEFIIAARLYEKQKFAEAETILEEIVRKYPNYLNAQSMLVDLYIDEGKYDEAYECFNAMRALGIVSEQQASEAQEYIMSWKTIDERMRSAKKD